MNRYNVYYQLIPGRRKVCVSNIFSFERSIVHFYSPSEGIVQELTYVQPLTEPISTDGCQKVIEWINSHYENNDISLTYDVDRESGFLYFRVGFFIGESEHPDMLKNFNKVSFSTLHELIEFLQNCTFISFLNNL